MRLAIVAHVKTWQDRPSFSVYNYGISTYDNKIVNWQIARIWTYDILFLWNNLQNIQLPLKIIILLDTVRNSDSSGKKSFSKKKRLNDSCKLSRRYAVNCPCNGRLSVHPSVCLSGRPTAAATSRWFAAELGRGQQISIDSCRRRAPPDDRYL